MREDNTGTGELKAAAQQALQHGTRLAQAGLAWIKGRREDMNPYDASFDRDEDQRERSRRAGSLRSGGERGYYRSNPEPRRQQARSDMESDWADAGEGREYGHASAGDQGWAQQRQYGERDYARESGPRGDYGQSAYRRHASSHEDENRSRGPAYGEGFSYEFEPGRRAEQGFDHRRSQERFYGRGYGGPTSYATGGYAAPEAASSNDYARGRGFRGRGPKNYIRSDARILEDVNERLTEDDTLDASEITVRCADGVITLEGIVEARWMKHRAEDLADASSGVKEIDNRIQVQPQGSLGTAASKGERKSGQAAAKSPTAPGGDASTSQH